MRLQEMINYELATILMEVKSNFKKEEFRNLETLEQKNKYAAANLQELGRGSSRVAFLLSNRYVLKIALPESGEKGIGQNKGEIEVFTHPNSKNVVSTIYDADREGQWLISELARPLSSPEEFTQLTGVSWDLFVDLIRGHKNAEALLRQEIAEKQKGIKIWSRRGNAAKVKKFEQSIVALQNAAKNPIVVGALGLIREAGLMPGDIYEVDHWAKTADGRIILIDYGFTRDLLSLYK